MTEVIPPNSSDVVNFQIARTSARGRREEKGYRNRHAFGEIELRQWEDGNPQGVNAARMLLAFNAGGGVEKRAAVIHLLDPDGAILDKETFLNEPKLLERLVYEMPDEVLMYAVKSHKDEYDEQIRQQRKEKIPALKGILKAAFAQAIDKGILPLKVNNVSQFIDSVSFFCMDPLSPNLPAGYASAESNTIYVALTPTGDIDFSVATHELLHLLGGRRYEKDPERKRQGGIMLTKAGLVHGLRNPALNEVYSTPRYFTWMDEAVTTVLTEEIIDTKQNEAYEPHVSLLNHLIEDAAQRLGIEKHEVWEVLKGTYFEEITDAS